MRVKVSPPNLLQGESPYDVIFAFNRHILCSRADRKLKSTCLAFIERVCHVEGQIDNVTIL